MVEIPGRQWSSFSGAVHEELHQGDWYDDGNEPWHGAPAEVRRRSDRLYRRILAGERPDDACWCCQSETVLALCRIGRWAAVPAERLALASDWIPSTRHAAESWLRRTGGEPEPTGLLAALPLRLLIPLVEDWEVLEAADLLELAALRDGFGPLSRRLQGKASAAVWEVARRRPVPGARGALARWRGAGEPPAAENLPAEPPVPDSLAAAVAGDAAAAAAWLAEARGGWRAWLLLALPLLRTADLARAAVATGAPTGVRLRWAERLPPEEGEDLLRREPLFTEEVRVPLLLDLERGGSEMAGALLRADDPGACRQAAAEWLRPDVLRQHPLPQAQR